MTDLFTSTEAAPGYSGWQRLPGRRRWERVTAGQTHEQVLFALLARKPPTASRDIIVLPTGEDANQPRRSTT